MVEVFVLFQKFVLYPFPWSCAMFLANCYHSSFKCSCIGHRFWCGGGSSLMRWYSGSELARCYLFGGCIVLSFSFRISVCYSFIVIVAPVLGVVELGEVGG